MSLRLRHISTLLLCLSLSLSAMAGRRDSEPRDLYTFEFDSLFLEALNLRLAGSDSLATGMFERCRELNPMSAAVCYELSALSIADTSQAGVEKGLEYMRSAVELDEDNYYYNLLLAQIYVNRDMKDEAAAQYRRVIKKFPDHDEPIYDLALLYNAMGEYRKSNDLADDLIKRMGWNRNLFFLKARNNIARNDGKDLMKDMNAYLEDVPLDYVMWVYKGDFQLEAGDREAAFESYRTAMRISPDNGAALMSLCRYYDLAHDREQTEYYLKKICASGDVDFETKQEYLSAAVYYWGKSPDAADKLEELQLSMISADDEDYRPRLTYAHFLDYRGRIDECIDQLRTATYLYPKCIDCWTLLLKNAIDKKDDALAEKVLDDALDAIPESPLFYYWRGVLAHYEQQPDSSLALLMTADSISTAASLAVPPDTKNMLDTVARVTMYNIMSQIYGDRGDTEQSLSFLRKALEVNPEDYASMNNYAYSMAVEGRELEEMEKLSFKTIKAEPLNASYLDTYAYILMKLQKYPQAEFYIGRAIEYAGGQEGSETIIEHQGDIKYFLGKIEEALANWKEALERGSDSELLPEKIKQKKYVE